MAKKSMKRENGQGSVYKRTDCKTRPWVAKAPTTYDENGTAKRITIGLYATAREAKEALEQYMESPTDKFNFTFCQAFEEWSALAYRRLSKQSKDCYNAAYKKLDSLYDLKLRDIRTLQMQDILDSNKHLSQSSLNKIKILLSQVMDYGVENDILKKNYAKFLHVPKKEKISKTAFTIQHISTVEKAAKDDEIAQLILILCYTGFRIGEFLALELENYHAEEQYLVGGNKTEASKNRIVPIHPKIEAYVKSWVETKGARIFCNAKGKPFSEKSFRSRYYAKLKELGLPRYSPHTTRHTFATMLSAANARYEDIQKLSGHSDFGITANTYIHQTVDTLREAILKLP